MQHNEPKPRRKLAIKLALLVFLVLMGWIVYDLFGPRTARLREFDADEVALLETAMWRSYYDKKVLHQSSRSLSKAVKVWL
ncbi:MAG TPA: hypothetical protein VMM84_04920 [Pyrinomonadaceae bacterium]|nr:hypothetical protein [Pyrinomonadaceae bacterium]